MRTCPINCVLLGQLLGLNSLINCQTLHVFLLILLAGDIATNPGPQTKPNLHCFSFNAQSIRSSTKLPNGSFTSNMKSFQDMVYAEELDIILMTETLLNDNFSDNEILSSGFNILRKDCPVDQRGGGVLIATRDFIPYKRIVASNGPNWLEKPEIVAVEIELKNLKNILVSVCYRPPSCNPSEWLTLFTAFLESCSHYDKVLITGDFNFPDLTWNSTFVPDLSQISSCTGSSEFRELMFDFVLCQVNMHLTRLNHILDLVLSTMPEDITNLSCLAPSTMNISSDHNLLFFNLQLRSKPLGHDSRRVYDISQADWNALQNSLNNLDLSPLPDNSINDD